MILVTKTSDQTQQRGVCVCVVILFILDVRLVDVPAGVTQNLPPSFCGACLNFYPEKDTAVPFPHRP